MEKLTRSLCPFCYSETPARVLVDGCVTIKKDCPSCGKVSVGLVEPDAPFYEYINSLPDNSIYDGLLVDITDRCNLNCKVCLHGGNKGHYDIEDIVAHCEDNRYLQPFFLSGGEPTLHPQFFNVYSRLKELGGVGIITNGIKFTDMEFLRKFAAMVEGDVLPVAFSVHPQLDIKQDVVDAFRQAGKKLSAVFWVITDLHDIDEVLRFYQLNKDVICQVRIKAATNIWKTQDVAEPLFVSDMYYYLQRFGEARVVYSKGNKPSAVNVRLNDLNLMLVAWQNVWNVDLDDLDCPPYYMAKDGKVYDFVSACLRNEGIERENL